MIIKTYLTEQWQRGGGRDGPPGVATRRRQHNWGEM